MEEVFIPENAVSHLLVPQGWNSEFGSNKVRKKLKQGKEKRLLARILEKARKSLSRQNSTKKCVNVRETSSEDMQVAGYAQFEKNWAV